MTFVSLKYSLLQNLFEVPIEEIEIINYIKANKLEPKELISAYENAIIQQKPLLAKFLLPYDLISSKFTMINRHLVNAALTDDSFTLKLYYPHFSIRNKTLDEIICYLLKKTESAPYRKRFIQALDKYGTVVLNNLAIMRYYIELEPSIDQMLAMDHSRAISNRFLYFYYPRNNRFDWLFNNYKIQRIFKLFLDFDDESISDSLRMINIIRKNSDGRFDEKIRDILGRKPASFYQIHQKLILQIEAYSNDERNVFLEQDISCIEGEIILDYTVSVPKTGADLIVTGVKQHICVGSYVWDVKEKKCQILNLLLDFKIIYTVELKKIKGKYIVAQIRGKHNELLEPNEEFVINQAILELINKKSQVTEPYTNYT